MRWEPSGQGCTAYCMSSPAAHGHLGKAIGLANLPQPPIQTPPYAPSCPSPRPGRGTRRKRSRTPARAPACSVSQPGSLDAQATVHTLHEHAIHTGTLHLLIADTCRPRQPMPTRAAPTYSSHLVTPCSTPAIADCLCSEVSSPVPDPQSRDRARWRKRGWSCSWSRALACFEAHLSSKQAAPDTSWLRYTCMSSVKNGHANVSCSLTMSCSVPEGIVPILEPGPGGCMRWHMPGRPCLFSYNRRP